VTGPLARWRACALRAVAGLIAFATVVSLARSATGLYDWALHHGWPWWSAWSLPAMIDVFIVVGELALFVGMVDRWRARWRAMGWVSVAAGWAVSVAGNAGHAGWGVPVADLVTYGIPPTAAAGALLIGLGVLKHTVAQAGNVPAAVPGRVPVAARIPGTRELRDRHGCGPETAEKIRRELRRYAAAGNGHGPREDVTA
jgi:hypothetical protein